MAETNLDLERRVERIELTVERQEIAIERLETAVGTMAHWLVQAQTGFGAKDAEGIEKILRGEEVKKD